MMNDLQNQVQKMEMLMPVSKSEYIQQEEKMTPMIKQTSVFTPALIKMVILK